MNKDVIYIEPEQDITDILSNVKAAKHKIIALVPPKKAGVLRSAVNFKLIAKTARQHEKTVVLITTDESLQRLASTVKMPVAKSLQSKPQIPNLDDEEEAAEEQDDVIEEKKKPAEEEKTEAEGEKVPVKTAEKKPVPVLAKKAPKEEVIEGEPEPAEKDGDSKSAKTVAKMKGAKIPNFAKYRKFIIAGMFVLILLIGFTVWATAIAPAADIVVTVHTSKSNFAEKVSFVTHEDKADNKNGVLFLEEKTVTKKAEAEFDATGELDKGEKASGTIVVTRLAGDILMNDSDFLFSIPAGTTVKINDKEFIATEGGSVNVEKKLENIEPCEGNILKSCLKKNFVSNPIKVVAKEVGDAYNISGAASISLGISTAKKYSVAIKDAISGGSSKIVKIVSEEDVKAATSGLTATSAKEAQSELKEQFGDEYILLGNMEQSDPKDTVTPNVDEEVGENVKPKVVREVTFKMFAVKKEAVKTFITAKLKENASGDKTQTIYDAGENSAFFEKFQNTTDESTAKLKASVITGPKVTEQMVADKSLGKKVGEVKHLLQSINGVSSVSVKPNYFWVTSVPSDPNKVTIKVTVEQ